MPRRTDKALRDTFQAARFEANELGYPWAAFARDLAAEVLELRREMRRLKRERGQQ